MTLDQAGQSVSAQVSVLHLRSCAVVAVVTFFTIASSDWIYKIELASVIVVPVIWSTNVVTGSSSKFIFIRIANFSATA